MQFILSKLSLIIRGKATAAIDKMMDSDTLNQLIIDLKGNQDEIGNDLSAAQGRGDILKKNIGELEIRITTTKDNIDLLLGDDDDSNDAQAVKLQESVIGMESEIAQKKAELQTREDEVVAIQAGLETIAARINAAESRLATLKNQEKAAEANERATATLKKVVSVTGDTADISLDAMEQRIEERAATATRDLSNTMAKVKGPEQSVTSAQAAAEIARRKEELKAAKSTAAAA